jgi:glycosyltransferase involved in cell wall biosynthesis
MAKVTDKGKLPRILMVSTEYPPMQGGVGRYTENLTISLRKEGLEVYVLCNEKGNGNYYGLSTNNLDNPEVISRAVKDSSADLVHIQYEPGLYGLVLNSFPFPISPHKTTTTIDSFYSTSSVPIVTTFHSAYTFRQWMNLASIAESTSKMRKYASFLSRSWKRLVNYRSVHHLNKAKWAKSKANIVFSKYLASLIDGTNTSSENSTSSTSDHDSSIRADSEYSVIYHGAEPISALSKREARSMFSFPEDKRIALALGFRTSTKGWDVLEKIKVPRNWLIVVNPSRNQYNPKEKLDLQFRNRNIVNLQKDVLEEEELSNLLCASDATLLPYRVSSASGVMFDGLAHGVPFIASDLPFFKEYSSLGLGIAVKRKPDAFANGLVMLDKDYKIYADQVNRFKMNLKWDVVAKKHLLLYNKVLYAPTADANVN